MRYYQSKSVFQKSGFSNKILGCPTDSGTTHSAFLVQSSYEIFMAEVKEIATEFLSLPNDS